MTRFLIAMLLCLVTADLTSGQDTVARAEFVKLQQTVEKLQASIDRLASLTTVSTNSPIRYVSDSRPAAQHPSGLPLTGLVEFRSYGQSSYRIPIGNGGFVTAGQSTSTLGPLSPTNPSGGTQNSPEAVAATRRELQNLQAFLLQHSRPEVDYYARTVSRRGF